MKHKMPKRPTRAQKKMIETAGYNWNNWLVADSDNLSITIIHKVSKNKKVLLC